MLWNAMRRALSAVLAVAVVAIAIAVPATAGPGDPSYLTVFKTVTNATPDPGEPFTFEVQVNCSEQSCLNAQLVDTFPAELAGFQVRDVVFTPSETVVPRTVTWLVDGVAQPSAPSVLTDDTSFTVDFTGAVTAPSGVGLQFGRTFTAQIELVAPADLAPGTYAGTNVADTTATNSAPDQATAAVTVSVAEDLNVATTKTWSPAAAPFAQYALSTIRLDATNVSNITATSLSIQEPNVAVDGATSLDADNPFWMVDFVGLNNITAPAGALTQRLDAYALVSGTWQWVTGATMPAAGPSLLPASVLPTQVAGIRLTYTGTAIDQGSHMGFDLAVAQRGTDRRTGVTIPAASYTLNNTTLATVTATNHPPATATASALHLIVGPTFAVSTTKDFSPSRIGAGESSTLTLGVTNDSTVPVSSLQLSDTDFFGDGVTFGGFGPRFEWPVGAQSVTVQYLHDDPADNTSATYVNPAIPAVSADADVTGVVLTFTGPNIAVGATATVDIVVNTDESVTATAATVTRPNEVLATLVGPDGDTRTATADDQLTIVRPSLTSTMTKTMTPSTQLHPGDVVVVGLRTHTVASSSHIHVSEVTARDAWAGAGTFWDGFSLEAIAPTQLPADTELHVSVRDSAGAWRVLPAAPSSAQARVVSWSAGELDSILATVGLTRADITGIEFTFHSVATDGLSDDVTLTPSFTARVRSALRSGDSWPTTASATLPNSASVTSTGTTPGGDPLDSTGTTGTGASIASGDGPDADQLVKAWTQDTVPAQSGQTRQTTLNWHVDEGTAQVVITDAGTSADLAKSSFDAFDLDRILPIAASDVPFSSGWYMKYDTVTAIELYDGSAWIPVATPAGGWVDGTGQFVGYVLTETQRATTTGVRITLTPNLAARTAASTTVDDLDPYVAVLGTGVGTGPDTRMFTLQWQVRNTTRLAGDWVTEQRIYNSTNPGVVINEATLSMTSAGVTRTLSTSDDILITNPGPGVTVRKQVNPTAPMYVPDPGTAANQFPAARFVVQAHNDSVSAASYVRVTDSPICLDTDLATQCETAATAAGATADPFDTSINWLTRDGGNNPFDRFTLYNIDVVSSIPGEVDNDASVVWLLHYNAGVYTTTQTTISAANVMTEAELADVVGVSVTYQGTNPALNGGSITSGNNLQLVLDMRVRTHLRSSGAAQDLVANQTVDVVNGAFAQSYDPVLNPGVGTGDYDTATAQLTGGDINVAAVKTVSPSLITEPRRHDNVDVTIGGNQGTAPTSTLAPKLVRVTDSIETAPEFWDYFSFVGLDSITAPAGADQVEVSVYGPFGAGGADVWVRSAPTPIATAAIPVANSQYDLIEGVEFVFTRADGGFFSQTVPAATWSTSIHFQAVLRDSLRSSAAAISLPDTVQNVVEVYADRLNGEHSLVREADAVVTLSLGTFELEVKKLANDGVRSASAGESVPWDLTFTNAGTGYLTIQEMRDQIPSSLLYLGATPVYTPDPSGMLGVPESVTLEGSDLVVTWPQGERTMAPGETFTMRIELELQPGLSAGGRATNTMVVTTAQTLDRCGPVDPAGVVTNAWTQDPTTCGASDYVTPAVGPNLFTVKGVRGSFPGAINPLDPSYTCAPTLSATGGDYYRAPCAANSVVGGVDQWVLRVQNAGTTGVTDAQIFDALPAPGDKFLISGGSRGSDYRPQMLNDLDVVLPAGATYTVETTSTAGACQGTWSNLENQATCEQNSEVWTAVSAATVWSDVTGIRLSFDFSGTATGMLEPGEFIDVTYSTQNVPASSAHPDGASVSVPVVDELAWNQFGVKYRDQGVAAYRKISPAHVGVYLMTGPIAVHKEVVGSAAALSPLTIVADVRCEVASQPVNMGSFASVTLNKATGYSARIDGIPVGADCVVSEQGNVGAFFEVARLADDVPVTVSQAIARTEPVPADQIATLINQYEPVLAYTGVDGIGRMIGWMVALLGAGVALMLWSGRRREDG